MVKPRGAKQWASRQKFARFTAIEEPSNEVTAACIHSLISSAAGRLVMLDMMSIPNLGHLIGDRVSKHAMPRENARFMVCRPHFGNRAYPNLDLTCRMRPSMGWGRVNGRRSRDLDRVR